jgi:hypothetical protein
MAKKNWQEVVENPDELKVFEALADPEWDFRTIDGIRKATGLSKDEVVKIIGNYEGKLIGKSTVPDAKGRDLFYIIDDRSALQETLAQLRTFISKSVR